MTQERQRCWGIFRERSHSPGREDDDAEILRATAKALELRGFDVALCAPQHAEEALAEPKARIFAMCEQSEIMAALSKAHHAGATVINAPDAVLNTYRHRTVELFKQAKVRAPESRVVATDPETPAPALPVWVKRFDFHATESDDVLLADTAARWRQALASFAERDMPFVVVQDHVPGDLIKFYGVHRPGAGLPSWFVWFYHREQELAGHAFDETALQREAAAAAAALGVEIFGGDAIVGPDGQPKIIDLNAWPSYALYRETAAGAIADHLAVRFARQPAPALD